jgi:autotransporter-associated beta strand protein
MPAEKKLFLVCRKTGKIVGFNRRGWRFKVFFPVLGILALIWYLVRVLPKPSRATYPCQRVGAPIAFGGLAYLLSIFGLAAAWRQELKFVRQNRQVVALVCLLIGFACAAVVIRQNETPAQAATASNTPIGIARGINPGRVVWTRDPATCLWDGLQDSTHWWDSNMVVQARVDSQLSAALQNLTGTTSDTNAWDALFRSFNVRRGNGNLSYAQSPNQLIVIKINQNPCNYDNTNYYALNGVENASKSGDQWSITGNPHLILSLIKQLVAANVQQTNIIIADATGQNRGWGGQRTIGDNIYLYVHPQFPNVVFLDAVGQQGRTLATWPTTNSIVYAGNYSGEGTSSGMMICQQFLNAGFLIDMAIAKDHGDGPTLCFKNLYGAISGQRMGSVLYGTGSPTYYSNLIEPMGSQQLGQKIMLFMIDALYGCPTCNGDPGKWSMAPFNNNWPCSLFLSQDPVAIDSVVFDFLNTQFSLPANTDNYLRDAASIPNASGQKLSGVVYQPNAGSTAFLGSLGVEEHWNNATSKQYTRNLGTGNGIELVPVQTATYSLNIISPPGACAVATGTNLPITALVYANTNPISQVAFYQGTKLLGTSTSSPYSITWSNTPAGTYALTAVVSDSMGLTSTSAAVNIVVSSGPLTWNASPSLTGVYDGGGVWNLTGANWWNGSTNVAWNNATLPSVTSFGVTNGAAGSVSLGAAITVNNLAFNATGSGNYLLSAGTGGSLTFVNTPAVSVAANSAPVISAPVAGTGFTYAGPGVLTLSGTNTLTGTLDITGGTLALIGNNTGATVGGTVTSGSTLQIANGFNGALALNSGSTLQLRGDASTTFTPSSITLDSAADTYNFDAAPLTSASGNTLTLTGALTFGASANQLLKVTGNSTYALVLGNIIGTTTAHNPYVAIAINTLATGPAVTLGSFQSGNWSQWLNLQGGGRVTITGNLTNVSNGSSIVYVTDGTTATLQGRSSFSPTATATADAYKYCVANGTLVLDTGYALTNNTSGTGLGASYFILGAATNVFSATTAYSPPAGVLVNTNNSWNAAVYLGDSSHLTGGITLNARITNNISDGDTGFANSGVFTVGGQNTSGTNTYANPIILGLTANKGKSVTLAAATGGEVDFAGPILANGTDTTAGVTTGDPLHGGTIKLLGTNTYAGPTTVSNGTLLVTGRISSGAVNVLNGAVLGGSGSLGGAVTVQAGGTLAPNGPTATLTVSNNLTLLAGSSAHFQIQALPLANNAVRVKNLLTLNGTLTVTNTGTVPLVAGDSYKLFTAGSYSGGFAAVTLPALTPGLGWNTNSLNTAGQVSVISIIPKINTVTASGANLVLSGGGGQPAGKFYVMSATNLTLPLADWTYLFTNFYDANGNFNFTNTVNPAVPAVFYLLQSPGN